MAHLETILKDTAKKGALTFGVTITTLVFRLARIVVLARILEPEFRGIFALLALVPEFLVYSGSFGLGASVTYHTGKKLIDQRTAMGLAFAVTVVLGFPLALIGGVVISQSFFFQGTETVVLQTYMWLIVLATFFATYRNIVVSILLGANRIWSLNLNRLLEACVPLFLFLVFYYALDWQALNAAAYSWFWGLLLVSVMPAFTLLRDAFPPKLNWAATKDYIRYGLREQVGTIMNLLNMRMGLIIVAVFLTPTDLGCFAVAVSVGEMIRIVPDAMLTPFIANLYNSDQKLAPEFSTVIIRISCMIMFVMCVGCMIFTWPFVYVVFGEAYLPAVPAILGLIPGMFAINLFYLLKVSFCNKGRPGIVSAALTVSTLIVFPIAWFVIPPFGLFAAGAMSTVAFTIPTILLLLLYLKEEKTTVRETLLMRRSEWIAVWTWVSARVNARFGKKEHAA